MSDNKLHLGHEIYIFFFSRYGGAAGRASGAGILVLKVWRCSSFFGLCGSVIFATPPKRNTLFCSLEGCHHRGPGGPRKPKKAKEESQRGEKREMGGEADCAERLNNMFVLTFHSSLASSLENTA